MRLIQNASKEKLRGGFYTPEPIANFILKWAVNENENYDILEPSCGNGAFLEQIKKNKFKYHSITAIEFDQVEAKKACNIRLPNITILNGDFFAYCNSTENKFDLVIGNPPYIRYQYFDKEQRTEAEKVFAKVGLKYSKLTNAWVSFVVGSSLLLKGIGKLGFVLPAEVLQVSYAKQLRKFLAHFYNKINIISFRKLVFPSIQQEVILLLCEKNNNISHLIEHIELENAAELQTLDTTKLKCPKKKIDFKSNKWTFYFLDQKEIDFIEKLLHQKTILPLRNYANVEVGMTTGFNKFFTVPLSTINEYHLQKYAKPMVGRTVQVDGIIFTEEDWKSNIESEARAYFLELSERKELEKNKKALEYVRQGEKEGIHKGYKCRIRDEWQIVPSAWVSEALFTRRNNIYPKLMINQVGAYTTDTMHRVTTNKNVKILTLKKVNLNALVASYYNSLSLAFTEICGRSHGGGALELMPNEVEDILLPYNDANAKILERIDKMIRAKKRIDEILKFTDPIILKESCGFPQSDIKIANNIWKKLLNRRLNRNREQ
ncbi:MAG: class I SAM-dependent methyltransferase [Nanoarchaeota archaeon]|nr:class I SAM-dependent methyltransferase [Nanoarchaeota archaeon]